MPNTLHIRQGSLQAGKYPIRLTLKRSGQADLEAEAEIEFALTPEEQADLRWYMEDYLTLAAATEAVQIEQIEATMRQRGEELYNKVLDFNQNTRAIWFAVREGLADLRVEIASGIAEAASIPWELMRDPQSDSAIALRVQAFVRIQSNPSISFVAAPPAENGRIRLLYVVCRPRGIIDVELRAIANRLLQDLGEDLARFEITALRPPTFEQLQATLKEAKAAGLPFHIVHFDGHGIYEDLSQTFLADWLKTLNVLTLGGKHNGKHGYLLFEHPESDEKMRPVSGAELGQLLHDNGVPVLVLNACQSAMHEAESKPAAETVHDEVRAIGSLAQAVIDQGIPAVLGMRYSVFVVTAAQYIGQLYAALAQGRPFGQAASEGRQHLALNPERWVGLEPRPLQDWFVPVVYEAMPMHLLPPKGSAPGLQLDQDATLDPVQTNRVLRRYVPDTGFVGRDETLLLLDRAFDQRPVVLLHAYAGQGKSASAVEFARWYAQTGGLGRPQPIVLITSFETQTDLSDVLNQIGSFFDPLLKANGIEWHALNENAARSRLVLQILQQIPVLWIWDNVEPVAGFPAGSESAWTPDEQADLADFLKQIKLDRATRAKILLTSRRDEKAWLGGIPYRIEMPRMSKSDAANLARSLGSEAGQIARKDIADWQALLDYCHGNPLTLRVIVGQALRQGLRGRAQIENFVEAVRSGEQAIEDADEKQGRDQSLGASLDYGFRNAFQPQEQPIVALLHLFQGTLDVDALDLMGRVGEYALPELQGQTKADLTGLLERAREIGLLTHLGGTWYGIHPALPWFLRQLFARHYNGAQSRSSASAALRAWVEAIGELGNYYHRQFNEGNRDVIQFLAFEEANLLQARRNARRQGWWGGVTSAMQGLDALYGYQGRTSEWARLVAEITPDFCTPDEEPLPGRENDYSLVMEYRVNLAKAYDRDLARAAGLQEKLIAWDRQQAALALALPAEAALDPVQRHRIRTLGVSVFALGQTLMEQGNPACVAGYEESILYHQRIQNTASEAIVRYNLGHAYKNLPTIRDLGAAEAAYQRSLALFDPNDALARSRAIKQIGMVYHARFREARQRGEPAESVLKHAQAAESHYQQALDLCPSSALTDLGPFHNQLGLLYDEVGQTERAREHYEKAARVFEQTDNRYNAGTTRHNLGIMYLDAAGRESTPARQRDLLRRAEAFAQAALRDFQHYQGRAAQDEADAQRLLEIIAEKLAKLE